MNEIFSPYFLFFSERDQNGLLLSVFSNKINVLPICLNGRSNSTMAPTHKYKIYANERLCGLCYLKNFDCCSKSRKNQSAAMF